jgi:dienelactone hydrolase
VRHVESVPKGMRNRIFCRRWQLALVSLCLLVGPGCHAEQHRVSVADCVSLGRIVDDPQVAPDGKSTAFIVKYPNTKTDHNEYEIRVRAIPGPSGTDNGRLIASYREEASGLRWLDDNRHLMVLLGPARAIRRESRIVELNVATGSSALVASAQAGVTEYSASADGRTVAYLTVTEPTGSDVPLLDKRLVARGFAVPPDFGDEAIEKQGGVIAWEGVGGLALWIARRSNSRAGWISEEIHLPGDAGREGEEGNGYGFAYNLSMAPNGRYLAFTYRKQSPSEVWMRNPTVRAYVDEDGVMPHGLALYDLVLHRFVDIPSAPFPHSIWWSEDSQAYASLSAAPIGSKWETEDALAKTDPRGASSLHVFAVDIKTLALSEVLTASQTKGGSYSVVSWKRNPDRMVIEYDHGTKIAELMRSGDEWNEVSHRESLTEFPLMQIHRINSGGVVGVHEDANRPPDLWYVDGAKSSSPRQLTSLNPQVAAFSMGHLEEIQWQNGYGATIAGKLLLPPGADGSKRYPLVIMLTWPNEEFVCDCQYSTAFAPQPLASAGFAIAIFNVYDAFGGGAKQPSGPPLVKEAESTLSSVESLVAYLDGRGVIQKDNVGIVGFSRSSWKVDYLITHSHMHLSAASSADGGIGNYGAVWMDDRGAFGRMIETGYGGPFSGSARAAWLGGAPAFNADRVSTPLLMEYTGMEGLFEQPYSAYEFHSALLSLGKPVELYFYPRGAHPLDSPFERVASLQRNVDWFRFWMQGYEGNAPDYDPGQYIRWRQLAELQDAEALHR